jgi:hypothetical protein
LKKLVLIFLALVIIPIAVFADWGVGGAAFYKSPVLLGQPVDTTSVNVDQLSFGGDLRFKLGWFQAEGLLLHSAGSVSSLNLNNGFDIKTGSGLLGASVLFWL